MSPTLSLQTARGTMMWIDRYPSSSLRKLFVRHIQVRWLMSLMVDMISWTAMAKSSTQKEVSEISPIFLALASLIAYFPTAWSTGQSPLSSWVVWWLSGTRSVVPRGSRTCGCIRTVFRIQVLSSLTATRWISCCLASCWKIDHIRPYWYLASAVKFSTDWACSFVTSSGAGVAEADGACELRVNGGTILFLNREKPGFSGFLMRSSRFSGSIYSQRFEAMACNSTPLSLRWEWLSINRGTHFRGKGFISVFLLFSPYFAFDSNWIGLKIQRRCF